MIPIFLPCFLGCMWVLDFVRRTEQKLCKSQAPPKASPDLPNEYHNRLEHGHLLLPVPHLAQLSRSSHQKRHPFLKNLKKKSYLDLFKYNQNVVEMSNCYIIVQIGLVF